MTTLQASLDAADRPVAIAPLRRRGLPRRREPCYGGPWRLPGPDSHRLAAVSLPLGYVTRLPLSSERRPFVRDQLGVVNMPSYALAGMSRSSPVQVLATGSSRSLRWCTLAPSNEPSVTLPFSTMNPAGLRVAVSSAVNEISPSVTDSVAVKCATLPVSRKLAPSTCISNVPPLPVVPTQ